MVMVGDVRRAHQNKLMTSLKMIMMLKLEKAYDHDPDIEEYETSTIFPTHHILSKLIILLRT